MKVFSVKDRAILREMVSSDFKVRYQGSLLGYLWSLLRPLFIFLILYVVFTYVLPLGKEVPYYAVQLFIGIILWNFFSEATVIGLGSVVSAGSLLRKVSIPRHLVVIASSVSALINLLLNLIVLFVFIIISDVPFRIQWGLLPLIILEVFVFAQGLAFLLSALCVKFRDIRYIWELILQAGFYATPIIYTATKIPEEFRKFFLLNPMAQAIQDARWMVIGDDSPTLWHMVSTLWAAVPIIIIFVVLWVGIRYFRRSSPTFAEDI